MSRIFVRQGGNTATENKKTMTNAAKNLNRNKYNNLSTARFALSSYTNQASNIFTDGTYYYIGGWKGALELGYTIVNKQ